MLAAAISALAPGRVLIPEEVNNGLDDSIDASIRRALAWLAEEQQPSGAWTTNDFGESTATTSLAIMSMLAGGHVPDEGPYGQHITDLTCWGAKRGRGKGRRDSSAKRSHNGWVSHAVDLLDTAGYIRNSANTLSLMISFILSFNM